MQKSDNSVWHARLASAIATRNKRHVLLPKNGKVSKPKKSIQHNEKGLSEADKARIDRANAKRALKDARRLEMRG